MNEMSKRTNTQSQGMNSTDEPKHASFSLNNEVYNFDPDDDYEFGDDNTQQIQDKLNASMLINQSNANH